jgi:acetyl esterase/lipase
MAAYNSAANVFQVVMGTITAVAVIALITLNSPVWAQRSSAASSSKSRLMTPQDLTSVPAQAPDQRVTYGPDANQFAELRVPSGVGPHPVVVLVHGGCFKTYGSFADLAAVGDALKRRGIATLNVEYRRVDQAGGGWPNTYLDVGHAVDHVRSLAKGHRLDLSRVVIVGHSAGGHLAMWAAARSRVPRASALFMANPLAVRGVVDLAGPLDLTTNIEGYEGLCRDRVVTNLMGGTPAEMPERYAQASPMTLLPLGVPQVVVLGEHEEYVPLHFAQAYVQAAERAGDRVRMILIPGAGHFEIASPRAAVWPTVEMAIRSLLDGKLPPP